LSTQVISTPSTTSRTRPVGSRLPVADPSVPVNSRETGAAVPGTPSIAVAPRYSGTPPGAGNRATARLPELTIRMRTDTGSPAARTSPRSRANGPTPASRLPQFCRSLTVASPTPSWRNR
jgi:hypothetical protein